MLCPQPRAAEEGLASADALRAPERRSGSESGSGTPVNVDKRVIEVEEDNAFRIGRQSVG
jgi:hypothetical protein